MEKKYGKDIYILNELKLERTGHDFGCVEIQNYVKISHNKIYKKCEVYTI